MGKKSQKISFNNSLLASFHTTKYTKQLVIFLTHSSYSQHTVDKKLFSCWKKNLLKFSLKIKYLFSFQVVGVFEDANLIGYEMDPIAGMFLEMKAHEI